MNRFARCCVVAACLTLAGCATPDTPAAPADSPAPSVNDRKAADRGSQLDERGKKYKDALLAAGIPASQPDSTTLFLAQGICGKLADGTPDPAILDNLRSLADYTASQSQGKLTGEQVARIYLDKAKSEYCEPR